MCVRERLTLGGGGGRTGTYFLPYFHTLPPYLLSISVFFFVHTYSPYIKYTRGYSCVFVCSLLFDVIFLFVCPR
ncbi:unnamed protein product, partial [Pylaiella littoralis]